MKPSLGFVKFAVACAVICALAGYAQPPETHGIAVENMDRSVKPGDDFYHFCNGDWIKRTEIPPDRAGVGVFTTLGDLTNKGTAEVIAEIAKFTAAPSSGPRKAAHLYKFYPEEAVA